MVVAYMCLNRFDEARAVAAEAVTKKADSRALHIHMFDLAFLKSDQAAMDHELSLAPGAEGEPFLQSRKASAQRSRGQAKLSGDSLRAAMAASRRMGMDEFVAELSATAAGNLALDGNCAGAKSLVQQFM